MSIIITVILSIIVFEIEGCTLNLFGTWPPLVLSSQTLKPIIPSPFISPTRDTVTIPVGTTIIISCEGGRFLPPFDYTKTIQATCNQDYQLEAQEKTFNFENVSCVNHNPVKFRTTGIPCAQKAVILEIGFQVGTNIAFIPQLSVCFDLENLGTLYVNYTLSGSISYIHSTLVTSYSKDVVYNISGIDFDNLYNVSRQQIDINGRLGLPLDSTKYINPKSCYPNANPGLSTPGFCFWMHHLADRGDFIFLSQQHVVYRYVNVVPKWYFVNYNLYRLERDIIDLATIRSADLVIFEGTYGVLQLPHSTTGELVDIYLYLDGSTKAIPVPLLFWKLVYNEETSKGTVFLTVNNPHLTEEEVLEGLICDDISSDISWLTWENKNITKGYSYACKYEDVKKVIEYLPDFYVDGVLS